MMCIVSICMFVFFFKQKTAYEMRISDWSSDVCSSDLRCPIWLGDRIDLGLGRLDTRQVRGGGERRLALDARDRGVRALARRAARAIAHRHETRAERRQPLDRLPQGSFHPPALGREAFDRPLGVPGELRIDRPVERAPALFAFG